MQVAEGTWYSSNFDMCEVAKIAKIAFVPMRSSRLLLILVMIGLTAFCTNVSVKWR